MVFLYKLSAIYAGFLKLLGYERGINMFIDRLDLDCGGEVRILDVGCGSGVVGLRLLERFPRATLLATDIEPNFLQATLANARSRGIDENRITVGRADVSDPDKVTLLDGTPLVLARKSFDLVAVGGVLAYSNNLSSSIQKLLSLVAPGGYFINLEMNASPYGRVVAALYDYPVTAASDAREIVEGRGHRVATVPFTLRHFPANLTRVGIVAKVDTPDDLATPDDTAATAPALYHGQTDYDYST